MSAVILGSTVREFENLRSNGGGEERMDGIETGWKQVDMERGSSGNSIRRLGSESVSSKEWSAITRFSLRVGLYGRVDYG